MNTQLTLRACAIVVLPLLAACGGSASNDSRQSKLDSGNPNGSGEGGNQYTNGSGDDSGGGDDAAAPDEGGTTPEPGDSSAGDDATTGGSTDAGVHHHHDAGGSTSMDAAQESGGGIVTPAIKAVMYLPNWDGSFANWANQIDYTKMTHLLLAFGTTDGSNNWDLGAADQDVQTLAAAAHQNNVKVLVSIGGADGDITIINQYQDASNIGSLVSNLDSFVSRLNLDGVDVDLERGTMMQSSSNYPAFVAQLISTFHPENKLVTTALAQYILQDANYDATIISTVNSFDFINDMIYTTNYSDYTNEAGWWTGTIGLPADKEVLGIEFMNSVSTNFAQQVTNYSKGYGGVMMWDYGESTEGTLWPAIQSAL